MDPTVVAAWIAAGVSVLTLAGTLAAQYFGYHATSRDAEKTAEEQRKQLDQTLAEQREQLDKTLKAQSEQLDRTLAEQRARTLNERFTTAAEQLGSDKPAAVRLAGVYAMAGLADDWEENRQICVDVLCAYLRMPYEPDPGSDGPAKEELEYRSGREVRHTVIRVITAHLRHDAAISWSGLKFDFTGTFFDGGSFDGVIFSSGSATFDQAVFANDTVSFERAIFSGGKVTFDRAVILSGELSFDEAAFRGGRVSFDRTVLTGGELHFRDSEFSGSLVVFNRTVFNGGETSFRWSRFHGGILRFDRTVFAAGSVEFDRSEFAGSALIFNQAEFKGASVTFNRSYFSGGNIDFSEVGNWSTPPVFPWTDTPPPGVKLPSENA